MLTWSRTGLTARQMLDSFLHYPVHLSSASPYALIFITTIMAGNEFINECLGDEYRKKRLSDLLRERGLNISFDMGVSYLGPEEGFQYEYSFEFRGDMLRTEEEKNMTDIQKLASRYDRFFSLMKVIYPDLDYQTKQERDEIQERFSGIKNAAY